MSTVLTEINAAAVKNSATDNRTPMMQQYLRSISLLVVY